MILPKALNRIGLGGALIFVIVAAWAGNASSSGETSVVSLEALAYKANFGVTAFLGLLALPFIYHAHELKKFRKSVVKPTKNWWFSTLPLWVFSSLALLLAYLFVYTGLISSTGFVYGTFNVLPILWLFLVAGSVLLLSSIAGYYLPLWLAGCLTLGIPFFLTLWGIQNQAGNILWANLLMDYMLTPGFSVSHEVNWFPVADSVLIWLAVFCLALFALRVGKSKLFTATYLAIAATALSFGFSGITQTAQLTRNPNEGNCSGITPVVCLWPEIDSAYPEQRNIVSSMVQKLKTLDYMEFNRVVVSTAASNKGDLILPDHYTQDVTPLAKAISTSVIKNECPIAVDPSGKIITPMQAQIALAILLGADPVAVAPGIQIETAPTPTTPGTSKTLRGVESLQYFGLENSIKVQNLFNRWSQQGIGACS